MWLDGSRCAPGAVSNGIAGSLVFVILANGIDLLFWELVTNEKTRSKCLGISNAVA